MKLNLRLFNITVVGGLLLTSTIFAKETITICGTGDSQELLKELGEVYELKHPNTKIIVPNSIGSGGGIKNTALGKCDLGRVAREIKDNEKKYNLNYIKFASSAVVFVINPSVRNIKNLTTQNIIDIYSGKIKRWEKLSKSYSGKIYVAKRESGDSSDTILISYLKGYKDIKEYVGKVIFNTQDTVKILVKYKNTIGYLPYVQTIDKKLIVLNLDGFAPTSKNINDGLYNLVVPFGLVYKENISALSKSFIKFIQSQEVKKIMLKKGVIQYSKNKT